MTASSTFLRNKLLALGVTLFLAIGWANIRINTSLRSLRGNTGKFTKYEPYGRHKDLMEKFRKNCPVSISIPTANSYFSSAEILYSSNFNVKDLFNVKNFNLCDLKSECKTMDIRLFVDEYFKEIKSSKTVLFKTKLDNVSVRYQRSDEKRALNVDSYEFYPDNEALINSDGSKNEEMETKLKILGFMFGLLFVTCSFTEIKFTPEFLIPEYSASSFEVSRRLVLEELERMGMVIHSFGSRSGRSSPAILINEFLWSQPYLNLHDWKDNSIFDSKGRIFWKVLSKLSNAEIMTIFNLATGFELVPVEGMSRLPKTVIEVRSTDGEYSQQLMFSERFKITIGPEETFESLKNKLTGFANAKVASDVKKHENKIIKNK